MYMKEYKVLIISKLLGLSELRIHIAAKMVPRVLLGSGRSSEVRCYCNYAANIRIISVNVHGN